MQRLALHMDLPALLKFPRSNYADDVSLCFSELRKFYMPLLERAHLQ